MVRRDVAGAKIARALARLDDAAATLALPVDEFLANPERRDLAIFYLFRRLHDEAQQGIVSLRAFLKAVADAAGL